jgi:hypothetical protein
MPYGMPEPHLTSGDYEFIELGGFDPDPTVLVGTETPSGPGTHPTTETNPSGQKSETGHFLERGDAFYEIWFGFNLVSATSLSLDTSGSVTLGSADQPTNDPLDTILALYLADESDGAILDQNDNCGGLVTSCLTFANLAAGEYIAGVSIIENGSFVPGWPYFMTSDDIGAFVAGDIYLNISVAAPSAVPVPATVWLFGSALIGFVGLSRRTSVKTC